MTLGILAGLLAGALWGLVFVAPRMAPGLSMVDLTAARFVTCGVLSALVMLGTLRSRRLPTLRQAGVAIGLSVLGFTGYYLLLALSIDSIGSEVPALVIGTIPIWVMLLGKPDHLRWSELLPGLVLTGAGLVLMMHANYKPELKVHMTGSSYWVSLALAVAAMVSWTAFAILNSGWLKRHPEVKATDWANWMGVAAGVVGLLLWLLAGSDSKTLLALDNRYFIAMVCIVTGIGSAWMATVLWNLASQRLSASLCGQLIVSETLFALVYSYAWDAQWPSAIQLTACVLFILGILASIHAHR